jgi:hypothetical protein
MPPCVHNCDCAYAQPYLYPDQPRASRIEKKRDLIGTDEEIVVTGLKPDRERDDSDQSNADCDDRLRKLTPDRRPSARAVLHGNSPERKPALELLLDRELVPDLGLQL